MLKHLVAIILLAILPSSLRAADFGPAKKLGEHEVLRGKFVEFHQQQLPGQPIRMEGDYLIAPEFGLIFDVKKPLPMKTIITPLGMVQTVGGVPVYKLSGKKSEFIKKLPGLLFAALGGHWNKLEREFTIRHYGSSNAWRISATPINPERDRLLFKTVSVGGGKFVDQAEVQRLDGLYDFFHFHAQSIGPSNLTNEEITDFKMTFGLPTD